MKTKNTFKLSLLVAALIVGAPAFASASAKLPAELPAFGKDKALPVPQITKKTLSNGLEVWVVPRQGIPRVDFVLAVRGAGYSADGPTQQGFASQLAGAMNEGTAKRDSRAIAEAAQGMGGSLSAAAGNDGKADSQSDQGFNGRHSNSVRILLPGPFRARHQANSRVEWPLKRT